MTALADTLRERASRRGQTAQVSCGALGTLTVESLPAGECSALAAQRGERGLLYAACRKLQEAGETLRREGLVFAPDEIMEYVLDREARSAAEVILRLSGGDTAAEKPEADPDPSGHPLPSGNPGEAVSGTADAGQEAAGDSGDAGEMPALFQLPGGIGEAGTSIPAAGQQGNAGTFFQEASPDGRKTPAQERLQISASHRPVPPVFDREPLLSPQAAEPERPLQTCSAGSAVFADTLAADKPFSCREVSRMEEPSGKDAPRSPPESEKESSTSAELEAGCGSEPLEALLIEDGEPDENSAEEDAAPRAGKQALKGFAALPCKRNAVHSQAEFSAERESLLQGQAEAPAGLPEISGEFPENSGRPVYKPESVLPETAHTSVTGLSAAAAAITARSGSEAEARAECGVSPETAEQIAWHLLDGLRRAAAVR